VTVSERRSITSFSLPRVRSRAWPLPPRERVGLGHLGPEEKHRLLLKKPVDEILAETEKGPHLKRDIGWLPLTALGVGAIVGTGIFVLIGPAIDPDSLEPDYNAVVSVVGG